MNAPTSPETPRASSLQQVVSGRSDLDLCAGDARVACPLFQAEYGGSKPTSALQLKVQKCGWHLFVKLTDLWHSRLPKAGAYYTNGIFFVAECNNLYYATAGWSEPIAIGLNGKHCFELRRFAIAPDAPKNTATRLLSVMIRKIKAERPDVERLVSYQDTEVHKGTIYKASGWKIARVMPDGEKSWDTHCRPSALQSTAPKTRWELALRESANAAGERQPAEPPKP